MSGTRSSGGRGWVAIVDFSLGNLFSVKHACAHAGLEARITSARDEVLAADAVFLPGVGAFPLAMDTLRERDLVSPLRDYAASGRPLIGICLGMQLLMSESEEFGSHRGLGLIPGRVQMFEDPVGSFGAGERRFTRPLKVPHMGWNRIEPTGGDRERWSGTPLADLAPGDLMYFVHSFYAVPDDPAVELTRTDYGGVEFCSSLRHNSVFACQFHPERSGPRGLSVYRTIASLIRQPYVRTDTD